MWQKDLITMGIKAVKKTIPKAPIIARTIRQAGNGQPRVVVRGFTGPNLDISYFMELYKLNSLNIRPVITGFADTGGKSFFKYITAARGRGFVKFFPRFRTPKMTRHVVYDVQTARKAVPGFVCDRAVQPEIVTHGTKITSPTNPIHSPAIARKRDFVEGFGGKFSKQV